MLPQTPAYSLPGQEGTHLRYATPGQAENTEVFFDTD
jgi:hypothetical protein